MHLRTLKNDFGDLRELAGLGAGVVLTGGGSRCQGTRQLCEEVFDLPVQRRHLPGGLIGAERLPAGQWASVLGLSMWAAQDVEGLAESDEGKGNKGWLNKLRGLFRGQDEDDAMAAEA